MAASPRPVCATRSQASRTCACVHHASAVREGRAPDDLIETARLKPLTKASLQEALREVLAAQRRPPGTPDLSTIPRI